jgi:hypothetical protein
VLSRSANQHRVPISIVLLLSGVQFPLANAELTELVPEPVLRQIAAEISGEAAKRNLDAITLQHRMRASRQFDNATRHIVAQLESYEMDEVSVLEYAADGKTLFGTQKSRPVWNVRFAELWELRTDSGRIERVRRLGDWDSVPLSLAQDSIAGEVTTSLVDIGAGASDADYSGKDLRGKLVLTSSQPEAVVDRAVGQLGAAGIVSYAPNQKSAWWKEDDRLVRWGHLGAFSKTKSFAFMISLGEARQLQLRLAGGETITLHAKVDASHEQGNYSFASAAIRGTDKAAEDIHLSCHLDHPRPGANDNASGCVSILEVARTLNTLLKSGILPRPSRTIRFLWPAEIEGSIMYLAEHEDPSRIKANIHMDMVGGGPVTKAVFRISGGPSSVPSFIGDLGHEIGRFVNEQTQQYTDTGSAMFPLVAREGGKEPLLALMEGLNMGSDHEVFFDSTWRIPGLYLHDWPDRYIHTNYDLAANIDPTKLKRAAFIGAVTAWYLATLSDDGVPAILGLLQRNALSRGAALLAQRASLSAADAAAVTEVHFALERQKVHSVEPFANLNENDHQRAVEFLNNLQATFGTAKSPPSAENDPVYTRNPRIKGPMHGFDYSYLEDHYGKDKAAELQLPRHTTKIGDGAEFAYEALNFVDGKRSVSDIRYWLMDELGEVPLVYVAEYLGALEQIGVIHKLQQ